MNFEETILEHRKTSTASLVKIIYGVRKLIF